MRKCENKQCVTSTPTWLLVKSGKKINPVTTYGGTLLLLLLLLLHSQVGLTNWFMWQVLDHKLAAVILNFRPATFTNGLPFLVTRSVVLEVAGGGGGDQRPVGAGGQQAGRGLGKLLILTWSYSVKNLSKHWESTSKLSLLFLQELLSVPAWHFLKRLTHGWQMCGKAFWCTLKGATLIYHQHINIYLPVYLWEGGCIYISHKSCRSMLGRSCMLHSCVVGRMGN